METQLTLYQSSIVHGIPRSTLNYRMKTETDEFKAAYVRETVIGYKNEDLLVERIIRCRELDLVLQLMTFAEWLSSLLYKTTHQRQVSSMLTKRLLAWTGILLSWNGIQKSLSGKVKQSLLLEHSA